MFEVEIASIESFRNLVKALSAILQEGCFKMDENSIQLLAMDPRHVAMVDFELPSQFFDRYVCEGEPKLSLRVGEFLKFLNRVGRDEQVNIKLDEKQARLIIQCKGEGHSRSFRMPILEPLEEEAPSPNVFFKASARILTQSLRQAIRDVALVGEQVEFEISGDHFKINAVGDMGSVYSVWEKGADELLELKAEEESSTILSLSYLRDIINAASGSSEVATLELSTDMPLKMNFELPQGKLVYYLAPLIGV